MKTTICSLQGHVLGNSTNDCLSEHHWMTNIEIKQITQLEAENGESVSSLLKEDLELIVVQAMNCNIKNQNKVEEKQNIHGTKIRYIQYIPEELKDHVKNRSVLLGSGEQEPEELRLKSETITRKKAQKGETLMGD